MLIRFIPLILVLFSSSLWALPSKIAPHESLKKYESPEPAHLPQPGEPGPTIEPLINARFNPVATSPTGGTTETVQSQDSLTKGQDSNGNNSPNLKQLDSTISHIPTIERQGSISQPYAIDNPKSASLRVSAPSDSHVIPPLPPPMSDKKRKVGALFESATSSEEKVEPLGFRSGYEELEDLMKEPPTRPTEDEKGVLQWFLKSGNLDLSGLYDGD
ncbi:hypothetical protein FRB93_012864 [Tulasnella sp. JGI-2019a]|nr:hypothetical protein FRB93_012864 [Tulasnella sp. JGI-2019a]